MDTLPLDVMPIIASKLGIDGLWRDINDVVADCCSLAMAGKSMKDLAEALAMYVTKETGIPRPQKPNSLPIELTINDKSTLDELKAEARRLRLRTSGRKQEIYDRLLEAKRVRDVELSVEVPRNPIPKNLRWKYGSTRRVTASVAKSDYRLNDDDLADLPVKLMRNPYGRNQPFMRLYDVSMVREVALEKYGGRKQFDVAVRLAEIRKTRMRETRETKAAARRDALVRALREVGCELRSDSRMCDAYICRGVGTPHEIAKVMLDMKFFIQHTRYQEFLRDNIAYYREWHEPYDIDEESHQAKLQALADYHRMGGDASLIPVHIRHW